MVSFVNQKQYSVIRMSLYQSWAPPAGLSSDQQVWSVTTGQVHCGKWMIFHQVNPSNLLYLSSTPPSSCPQGPRGFSLSPWTVSNSLAEPPKWINKSSVCRDKISQRLNMISCSVGECFSLIDNLWVGPNRSTSCSINPDLTFETTFTQEWTTGREENFRFLKPQLCLVFSLRIQQKTTRCLRNLKPQDAEHIHRMTIRRMSLSSVRGGSSPSRTKGCVLELFHLFSSFHKSNSRKLSSALRISVLHFTSHPTAVKSCFSLLYHFIE